MCGAYCYSTKTTGIWEKKMTDKSKKSKKQKNVAPTSGNGPEKKKENNYDKRLPVVGIGASAGGLGAYESLFTNMPADTGMAFVLIQHLEPSHKSILAEIVSKYTQMNVKQVEDGDPLEPNKIYVIPPNRYMSIYNGKLLLHEPKESTGPRVPIDYFFKSLAEDQEERAICMVLSGTGTEGAAGIRAIKGKLGMAMVQAPETAKYDGMPKNAISTGLVDYILAPEEMPKALMKYVDHALYKLPQNREKPKEQENQVLPKIFSYLRSRTGHDFSSYKRNTILRRIDRRMAVHQLTKLRDYLKLFQNDPGEIDILFKELLIGVTGFFRDKEAFEALEEHALKPLIQDKNDNDSLRIWVTGCATGEEAYSIGILCKEIVEELEKDLNVQIFATDIDNSGIEFARQGCYTQSISVDMTEERLEERFTKQNNFYRVNKDIRDMLVFATQNVITDPPFSRIDLISCRNLLIYLDTNLQKKVLPIFHYSLSPGGFLFLGGSETIGTFSEHFAVIDKKWKIFRSKDSDLRERPEFEVKPPIPRLVKPQRSDIKKPKPGHNFQRLMEDLLLNDYGPTALIVNNNNEIVYIHGKGGKFLEPSTGAFTGDIMAMAREGLRLELATAMQKATKLDRPVRKENLSVKTNGGVQLTNLVVKPISDSSNLRGALAIIFEEVSQEKTAESKSEKDSGIESEGQAKLMGLQHELDSTKQYLQTTVEELETSNEELKSTNEELQSSNEELQSTNEELETSKEELQSVNEELTTVNSEHQQKIEDLKKANDDLNNLLASTEIGTIFLDKNLRIKRFTPSAKEIINLIDTDIGRPVSHIVSNFKYDGLIEDAKEVLRTLTKIERDVQTDNRGWYQMRILPYRTDDNAIEGVVVNFSDISDLKAALRELEEARKKEAKYEALKGESWETVADVAHEAILILNKNLEIEEVNQSFLGLFNVSRNDTKGKSLFHIGDGHWDTPEFRELLENILPEKKEIQHYRVEEDFKELGQRTMLVNAKRLDTNSVFPDRIIMAVQDITEFIK